MKNDSVNKRPSQKQTIEEILKKPYARILTPDSESRGYAAEILEFPGCVTQGDTPDEAYRNLEEVARDWLESSLNSNQDIPEPSTNVGYSGKVALRLPRNLHRRAIQMAERDNTSLNQFLVSAISERVGAESLFSAMLAKFQQGLAQTNPNTVQFIVVMGHSGSSQIIKEASPPIRISAKTYTPPTRITTLQIEPSQQGATAHG